MFVYISKPNPAVRLTWWRVIIAFVSIHFDNVDWYINNNYLYVALYPSREKHPSGTMNFGVPLSKKKLDFFLWLFDGSYKWSYFPSSENVSCRNNPSHWYHSNVNTSVSVRDSFNKRPNFYNQYVSSVIPLRWRHNGHDGVSNHQPHDCLLKRLYRRRFLWVELTGGRFIPRTNGQRRGKCFYVFYFIAGQHHCIDTVGLIYSGTVYVTQQDIDCQRWDSQQPHAHSYTNTAKFPDDTLADASNYCRAPDGRTIPWCFTTSVDQRWDYCNMDDINAGIQCKINCFKLDIDHWQKKKHFDTYDLFGQLL